MGVCGWGGGARATTNSCSASLWRNFLSTDGRESPPPTTTKSCYLFRAAVSQNNLRAIGIVIMAAQHKNFKRAILLCTRITFQMKYQTTEVHLKLST